MPHDFLRRGAVVTAVTLLGLQGAGVANAQSDDGPSSLDVVVTGPSTGQAGGTGEFAVVVQNTGRAPVRQLQLSSQLPEGVTVRSVGVSDSWACALGRSLQCTLEGELRAGQTTMDLPFELFYDGLVEGRQEIGVVVEQGRGGGALRYDRGLTIVDVEPEPEPEPQPAPPAQEPAPAQPAPEQPAPAQPAPQEPAAPPAAQPVTEQPAAQAPVQRRAHVAAATSAPAAVDVPATASEPASDPAQEPEPAAADQAPSTLPFADDGASTQEPDEAQATGRSAGGSEPPSIAASRSSGVDDLYTVLLALVFGVLLVAFLYLVARVVLQRRGRLA